MNAEERNGADYAGQQGLVPGTQIGPYRLESEIGRGGMGAVYRALDTKLNRIVAIKVLSDDFADAAARRRFQREAQMASSLNHPHIVTVHDAGDFDGRQYLVTEFVDGGTLKPWVQSHQPEWRDVLELLTGVADGLAAAHDAGILHRDIKPANILITKSGYAKLADFGLAKLAEQPAAGNDATRTITDELTRRGTIVGTIAYMSPEQASGRNVDARSDVFSFGVVLYEVLAGRRPFVAPSDLELLQTIIHGAPQPLAPETPPAVRALIEKALQKDPAERYPSMREMAIDLRRLMRQSVELPAPAPRAGAIPGLAMTAALIVVLLIAGNTFLHFHSRTPPGPLRLEYVQLTNFSDSATSPALSPDGRMLAFIRGPETFNGPGDIYLKMLPDGDPVQLTHDGLAKMSPAFTPDGARIAFTRSGPEQMGAGATWTVAVPGGSPTLLLAGAEALSFIPTPSGPPRILFSELEDLNGTHLSIKTAAQNRSDSRLVYAPPRKQAMAHRSYLSPDGKNVLVVEMDGGWLPCRLVPFNGNAGFRVVGPSPGQCTTAAWSPDGKWMYFSANTGNGYHVWRQRFPDGPPEQLTSAASEEEGIAFAPDGRSFVTSVGTTESTLWVHDARGERQITSQGYGSLPQFSPDGKTLYYLLRSHSNRRFVSGELWAANLETGQVGRLLPDFVMEHYSISTDGRRIVFAAIDEMGHSPVWLGMLDGSSAPRRLSTIDAVRTLFGAPGNVYFLSNGTERFIYRVHEDGSGLQKALVNPIGFLYDVSPDGKSLAVNEGGAVQLYPTSGGAPTPVCTAICGIAGGPNRAITPPAASWSRDGKFFYINVRRANEILAVPIPSGGNNLPSLPSDGVRTVDEAESLPGARIIHEARAYVGANPSVYAIVRAVSHRNIYRISGFTN
jgi:serine/threonine protein kinase/Tol biopolymer transport system component